MPAAAGPGRAEQPGRGDCRPARWRCSAGRHRRRAARAATAALPAGTAAGQPPGTLAGRAGGRPEDGGGPTCGAPGRRPVSRGISGYGVRSLSLRRHRVSAAGLDVNEVEHLLRPHAELDRALLDRGRRLLGRNLLLQLLYLLRCQRVASLQVVDPVRRRGQGRVDHQQADQPAAEQAEQQQDEGGPRRGPPRRGMQVWRRARGTGPRGRRRRPGWPGRARRAQRPDGTAQTGRARLARLTRLAAVPERGGPASLAAS